MDQNEQTAPASLTDPDTTDSTYEDLSHHINRLDEQNYILAASAQKCQSDVAECKQHIHRLEKEVSRQEHINSMLAQTCTNLGVCVSQLHPSASLASLPSLAGEPDTKNVMKIMRESMTLPHRQSDNGNNSAIHNDGREERENNAEEDNSQHSDPEHSDVNLLEQLVVDEECVCCLVQPPNITLHKTHKCLCTDCYFSEFKFPFRCPKCRQNVQREDVYSVLGRL